MLLHFVSSVPHRGSSDGARAWVWRQWMILGAGLVGFAIALTLR